MSIRVALDQLAATLDGHPWGYVLTVDDDERTHALAVPTDWRDGALHFVAGRGTRANVVARPSIAMVFPGVDGSAYSLVVDGTATVAGDDAVRFTPSAAVLHRPALPAG